MTPETLFRKATHYQGLTATQDRESERVLQRIEAQLYTLLDRIPMSETHRKMIRNKIEGVKRPRSPTAGNKRGLNVSRTNRSRANGSRANGSSMNGSRPFARLNKPVRIRRTFKNTGMASLAKALPPALNSRGSMRNLLNALPSLNRNNNSLNRNKNRSKRSKKI